MPRGQRSAAQKTFSLERLRRTVAQQACELVESEWLGDKVPHRCRCANGHDCLAIPRTVQFGKAICKTCRPGGFGTTTPAVVYLITNDRLGAHKVGIAATTSQRLKHWARAGWDVVDTMPFELGAQAWKVEAAVLAWLRDDLGLAPFLGPDDTGRINGWSESVDASRVDVGTIWARVVAETAVVRREVAAAT